MIDNFINIFSYIMDNTPYYIYNITFDTKLQDKCQYVEVYNIFIASIEIDIMLSFYNNFDINIIKNDIKFFFLEYRKTKCNIIFVQIYKVIKVIRDDWKKIK